MFKSFVIFLVLTFSFSFAKIQKSFETCKFSNPGIAAFQHPIINVYACNMQRISFRSAEALFPLSGRTFFHRLARAKFFCIFLLRKRNFFDVCGQ